MKNFKVHTVIKVSFLQFYKVLKYMISDLEPAMKYSFCDFANHKVSLALSKCLSKWINWIYPYRVSRILSFEMEGSTYEFLESLLDNKPNLFPRITLKYSSFARIIFLDAIVEYLKDKS